MLSFRSNASLKKGITILAKKYNLPSKFNPLSARIFTVFGSLLEDRVLHTEAWQKNTNLPNTSKYIFFLSVLFFPKKKKKKDLIDNNKN